MARGLGSSVVLLAIALAQGKVDFNCMGFSPPRCVALQAGSECTRRKAPLFLGMTLGAEDNCGSNDFCYCHDEPTFSESLLDNDLICHGKCVTKKQHYGPCAKGETLYGDCPSGQNGQHCLECTDFLAATFQEMGNADILARLLVIFFFGNPWVPCSLII
mmetsp:Transcript_104237/g.185207  ORF Transcript_104237/g.185207 Transcript_104237/m.185207 type:complete len:160 (-) Transcript_104237:190-669(-)|eukprot:CAMPEP_0197657226 /NCGR_PEP_ID=MMETSP1338-20131121/44503_1 /TAXON_ID=43686 ORGANISM="Pelagodinium beii, Strain RCC1491" /NCGR_SAMPLE_ID=MMETSP1338 /ASSEMBLY_ACC=CAM_ASM_000754 /LENGTH=159 /DNA_ID=CAMNT_0043233555 /DNA_START=65 /DNA_END=544 /DNA_ORIENTATION=-